MQMFARLKIEHNVCVQTCNHFAVELDDGGVRFGRLRSERDAVDGITDRLHSVRYRSVTAHDGHLECTFARSTDVH